MNPRDKHSSLFRPTVIDEEKSVVRKFPLPLIGGGGGHDKLECWSLKMELCVLDANTGKQLS
jgi:hypothetical protein